MSMLQHAGRPWQEFDPLNSQHRQWFHEFQATGSWSKCPVRFFVNSEVCIDLPTELTRAVSRYYSEQEFKTP